MPHLPKSEIARQLGCTRQTVHKWCALGLLTDDQHGRVDLEAAGRVALRTRNAGRRLKSELRVWDDAKPNKIWLAALRAASAGYRELLGSESGNSEQDALRICAIRILAHVLCPSATTSSRADPLDDLLIKHLEVTYGRALPKLPAEPTDSRKLPILPPPADAFREAIQPHSLPWVVVRTEDQAKQIASMADAGGSPGDTARLLKLWHCCRFYPLASQGMFLMPLSIEEPLEAIFEDASARAILAVAALFVVRACHNVPPQEFALLLSAQERAELSAIFVAKEPPPEKLRAFRSTRYARKREGKVPMREGAVQKMVTLHGLLGCNRAMARHWRKSTRKLFREVERLVKPPRTVSTTTPKTGDAMGDASESLFDQQLQDTPAAKQQPQDSEAAKPKPISAAADAYDKARLAELFAAIIHPDVDDAARRDFIAGLNSADRIRLEEKYRDSLPAHVRNELLAHNRGRTS